MSNLVKGGNGFFKFFKGGRLQKNLGNPGLKSRRTSDVPDPDPDFFSN